MKKILLILLLSFTLLPGYSQSKLSPYSRIEMAKRYNPDTPEGKRSNALRNAGEVEYINAFVGFSNADLLVTLREMGIKLGPSVKNSVIAAIPVEKVNEVAALEEVTSVSFSTPVHTAMDKARLEGKVNAIQQGTGLSMPYTGKEVVVGIVDCGIEFAHLNFYDKEGKELRVKRVWNQYASEGGTPVVSTTGGVQYTTPEEMIAARYDLKNETHGTHVAGIAAGADRTFNFQGIAPEAELVLVATKLETTSLIEGVNYCMDYAASVGKPCVINLSIGGDFGPHDGTSDFDQHIDQMVDNGAIFVTAAGNSGNEPIHIKRTFAGAPDTLRTFLEFAPYSGSNPIGVLDLYGEKGKHFSVWLTITNYKTGQIVFASDTLTTQKASDVKYTRFNGGEGLIHGASWINPANGRGNIFFETLLDRPLDHTDYRIAIHTTATDNEINGWSSSGYNTLSSYGQKGYTDGDSQMTVSETGATANRAITVGSYSTKKRFQSLKDGKTYLYDIAISAINDFSSRGPRADGQVKPDVTAPGSILVSSFSSAVYDDEVYGENFTAEVKKGGQTYYWGVLQGTSMAAPYTAGVIALWLQADPTLSPEEIKDILRVTSTRDTFTGEIPWEGSNTWGQGKIHAMEGLKEVIRRSPVGIPTTGTDKQPLFLIHRSHGAAELFFVREATDVTVELADLSGQILHQRTHQRIDRAQTLEIQLPAKGLYLLRIRSANGVQTEKIAY